MGGNPLRGGGNPRGYFPAVLKDEVPSSVVIGYMDGLSKRIAKVIDPRPKLFIEIYRHRFTRM